MVSVNFKIDERELLQALDIRMDEVVDQIFADSQNNIVSQGIIDEGTLLKSGVIKRKFLEKEIVYQVPYADTIEFGRTPGTMPPVTPIANWVKRHGMAKTDTQAKSIAFAIANKIKKEGTQPRPFLGPAVEKAKAKIK